MTKKGKRTDAAITDILREFEIFLKNGVAINSYFFEYTCFTNPLTCSFFLEEKILGDIISLAYQGRSNETMVQIINTISMLVQNNRDDQSLCIRWFGVWSHSFPSL